MHNNIMAAGSKDRPPMLGPGRYSQSILRYERTIIAQLNSREHSTSSCKSKKLRTIHKHDTRNKLIFKAEKKLFSDFDCLLLGDGESMESYYSRFYKLMNELTRNNLQVSPMQVNVQFLQQLQPEWSRFVTVVKQRQEIDTVSYHKLFDVLKQFQNEVNDIRSERLARSANPLALLAAAQPYSDNYYQAPKPQRSNAPSYMQSSSTRPSASTRHKGKEIAKPVTPQSESVSEEDSDPEQARRDKDMQKNLALLAKYFKKLYKPTNNNLRTSSNSRNKTEDTTPRYNNDNQSGQFGNQRTMTVAGARETVGSPVVQKTGIQCFNCKGFGHYARECRKPKRVKDYAYHKEKMMMCKQAEQGVPLQAEQADWLEDTDEEIDEQELEAHYSYMAKIQEVSPAESSSTDTPLEQVQNHDENDVFANVRRHSEQPESINDTYVLEKDDSNVIPDSSNICTNDNQVDQNAAECVDERAALANLIANLTLDTEENKTILKQLKKANASLTQELKECKTNLDESSRALGEATSSRDSSLIALQTKQTELEKYTALNDLTSDYKILQTKLNDTLGLLARKDIDTQKGLKTKTSEISVVNQKHDELVKKSLLNRSQFEGQLKEKTKVISDLKVKEGKDIDTMIEMDKQIKFLNEILYKRNQSIQTIHMLAPKCMTYNGRSTFANPKYLKRAQSDKPCLYEIPYDTSDPANRFAPDGEEIVTLAKESRSKLDKDKVKPYDYTYQNSLYETFKPPSKTYLDQLERAKEVRKTMWRKTFVRTKPNIAKNIGFLPMSKSISKSRLLYNEMTNNFNHFRTICQQTWSNHTNSAFPNPTAKSMEVLIKTLLMPLSNKTILDSHCFVHELKKEMHDDLEYVKSLEKEIDELESEKADFSNIYDLLLKESEKTDSSHQGLEFLFSPLLEEYYNPTHGLAEENNNDQAPNASFQEAEFINPFCTRNPTIVAVQTRRQLATDPEMCMFALTVSIVEPKNIKEAMADSAWIEAMQDELHHPEFRQTKSWELMDVKTAFLNGPLKEEVYVAHKKDSLITDHHSKKSLPSKESFVWIKASSKSLDCKSTLSPKGCLDTRKSSSGGIQSLVITCKLDVKETKLHCNVFSRGGPETNLNATPYNIREQAQLYLVTHVIKEQVEKVHKLLSRVLRNIIVIFARTFRVILFSIHNDEWKSFQCHHQTALRSNGGNGNLNPIQMLNLRRQYLARNAQDLKIKTSAITLIKAFKIMKKINREPTHTTKQALGFQNPLYLKKAQQLKPKLYDGNVIKNTSAIVIPDSEETLLLAEESRSKMLLKQKDPMIRSVPQTELFAEQAFWSHNSVNSPEPTLSSRPTKVEVPNELPKVSMVNTSLKKLKHHLTGFDVVVKERTIPTAITEGSWGFELTKACFRDEIIPFVKALKDLFNTFDQYLIDELSEAQNLKFLSKENAISNQSASSFDQLFELNEYKAQSQEKDTIIKKLKERIKSLSGKMYEDKIKKDLEEIDTINIELDHRVSKLIAENKHLKQTYKQLYDSIKPARIRSKEQCDDLINQVNLKSVEISDLNASL
ncbi:integrase, catalytic region, zinc finger, CCHC-type containing protein [Tanacetum coccineum]|uniref:Integrase, catalytic region, zinc finger, CCHC-type containing protein n=1 Tax=Tanacetum coccineum TaxID=301880 RepID=A0ABQ5EJ94_9ASTR